MLSRYVRPHSHREVLPKQSQLSKQVPAVFVQASKGMYYAHFPVSSGQLASGPWFPAAAHPLAQLAVDGQVLSAKCSSQVLPKLDYQIEPAAMRSKEALAALTVLGAAALAAQHPGLIVPGQKGMHAQCGLAPAFCFGSSTSTAGSPASTPTPLHALQSLRQSSCFFPDAVDGVVPTGSWNAGDRGVSLQPGAVVGTGLDDSTSPLSACSRLTIAGAPTPCGSEALSGTQAGCKRTHNQAFQQQQQQQQLQYHQQVQYRQQVPFPQAMQIQQQQGAHTALMQLQKQAQQTKQMQQQQMQAALAMQPAVFKKQPTPQQVQTYLHVPPGPATGYFQQQQRDQQTSVQLQQRLVPADQLLVSQSSANSSTSDGTSRQQATAAPNLAMLLQQQQHTQQCQQQQVLSTILTSVVGSHQQQQQQSLLLRPSAVSSDLSSVIQANCHSRSWAAYLQRLREQQLQPPSKRAATAAAYAALVTVATKQQQQQQAAQALLRSGTVSSCRLPHAPAAGLYDSSKLLGWAGQVLNCQLSDAYRMAQHIYSRASAQLDDMLLITLGVTQPMDKVTMLVSLWLATKLEGHRRQVVGCSKVATALQMVPWAVTSIELHIMQALSWRPYAGYGGQSGCVVSEL